MVESNFISNSLIPVQQLNACIKSSILYLQIGIGRLCTSATTITDIDKLF